jgi:acyl-coenzyme A synthetase/AMP-(fatty) acid ligase
MRRSSPNRNCEISSVPAVQLAAGGSGKASGRTPDIHAGEKSDACVVPGCQLDAALKEHIANEIRTKVSARHVPNEVYAVDEIPRTLTGKKMEVQVR